MNRQASTLLNKGPCPSDGCGSSDGFATYSDGHGFCFVCHHFQPGDTVTDIPTNTSRYNLIDEGVPTPLPSRGLTAETCEHWGYGVALYNGQPVQVANYRVNGVVVAQKVRWPNKEFKFLGDTKSPGLLYGQHLWRDGGRRIVVSEGEIDAMSISQAYGGNQWTVFSIPSGAQGAAKSPATELK